jgi:hypothetical protein
LHDLVLRGDAWAADRVGAILISQVKPIVCARRRGADAAISEQATLHAVVDYLFRPGRFDCRRSTLLTWIAFAAIRNVDDQRRADARRRVAEAAAAREWARIRQHEADESERDVHSLVRAARLSDTDSRFVVAWVGGRPVEDLAEILGVSNLPEAAMKMTVGRAKERLRLRLKRGIRIS